MLVPLILSGGSGTRLWPLSRRLQPKQLLPLTGPTTMLQQTVQRAEGLPGEVAPLVVCNVDHATMVEAQLRQIERPARAIVLEPVGRNTAPAVALAALLVLDDVDDAKEGDDPLLLVLPADHVVQDPMGFRAAVEQGIPSAKAGKLVTFGIVPDSPHTGYGYIRAAAPGQVSAVQQFVEKPDRATAERYLAEGGYYWNSGMFLMSARTYLGELREHRPAMVEACEKALASRTHDGAFVHVDLEEFSACPSDSIDYAVMEKTTRAMVVPMDVGWNDVGSWAAVHDVSEHESNGNSGLGDVLAIDCHGSHLQARSRLLAAVGVRDLVIVETEDAVLVVPRERSQDVKKVVERLEAEGRPEASGHREHPTPWGRVRRLDARPPTSLWELQVSPGKATPVESHMAWDRRLVVLSGEGELRWADGTVTKTLRAGDSERVPAGIGYVLEAASAEPLELLAVDLPA